MNGLIPIVKRELLSYFRSPVAYIFIIIFLISTAGATWFLGSFYFCIPTINWNVWYQRSTIH
ncbi:MAG: hypothetical protein IIA41_00945 [SAR324 cluster bacterium]|nr:hypothetical protein [SAR324 cluster bacterium]